MFAFRIFFFFLVCIVFNPRAGASPAPGIWYGDVNGYPVLLCFEANKAAYYYPGRSEELLLKLESDTNWQELSNDRITGQWNMKPQGSGSEDWLGGTWRSKRSNKNLPVQLRFLVSHTAACSSDMYLQMLLRPNEPRLNLPVPHLAVRVVATDGAMGLIQANGDFWSWKQGGAAKKEGGDFVQVAMAPNHFAGIKADGSLWGWGSNNSGQLGGESVDGSVPIQMEKGIVEVAASDDYTLAIRNDGTLWSWGGLQRDTKGNPLGTRNPRPTFLGKSFIKVSAGANGSFAAIKADGSLWLWGRMHGIFEGSSRNGRMYDDEPVPIRAGDGYTQVSVGYGITVAVKQDGSLWSWGRTSWDASPRNSIRDDVTAPEKIGEGYVQALVSGSSILARRADGSLWVWGRSTGLVGDCKTNEISAQPVRVVFSGYSQVAFGGSFWLGLTPNNTAQTLGWHWDGDQLDVPLACRQPKQVDFAEITRWKQATGSHIQNQYKLPKLPPNILAISAGGDQSALVRADGSLWTWGNGESGQLGNGKFASEKSPKEVGTGFTDVFVQEGFVFGLKEDGILLRWGGTPESFVRGDLRSDSARALAPVKVFAGTARILRTSHGRGLGVRADSTLLDWGYFSSVDKVPTNVGSDIKSIASGYPYSYVIRRDGSLWKLSQYPVEPPPEQIGRDFVEVASAAVHTYAIKADGSLWAWGGNFFNQLGDGGLERVRSEPVRIGDNFVQVSAGLWHGIALAADGSVWTWGNNEVGQLGDGTTQTRARPIKIAEGFSRVADGNYHNLALKNDGTLWAWGANEEGQLGDTTQIKRLAPVQVFPYQAPATNGRELKQTAAQAETPKVTAVGVGLYFSCVSISDGQYKCWGSNSEGQLGNSRRMDRNPFPVIVEDKSAVAHLFSWTPSLDCAKGLCEQFYGQYPSLRGSSVVAVKATRDLLCGIRNGRVRCAYKSGSGLSPFTVHNLHEVVSFDHYGADHGCALVADGRVKCWGSNSHGQLGIGSKDPLTYVYSMPIASTVELREIGR